MVIDAMNDVTDVMSAWSEKESGKENDDDSELKKIELTATSQQH